LWRHGMTNSTRISPRGSARILRSAWTAPRDDAEYVGLARFLGAPLVTVDARLRRRASTVVKVVGPTEG
jgi:predicted nucleic acid-binding protein